jgi:uncharacterized protein (TIGR02996 family)
MFDPAAGPALLRAVLENPSDDQPRLAYSDWLEERADTSHGQPGDAARAELIRVMCGHDFHVGTMEGRGKIYAKVGELWDSLHESLLAELPGPGWQIRPFLCSSDGSRAVVTRGFVSEAGLSGEAFAGCAAALFAAQPIERLHVYDHAPATQGNDFWWADERCADRAAELHPAARLPAAIFERLGGMKLRKWWVLYTSADRAYADMEAAYVAHGRHLAGLPPLGAPHD